jgi:acetyl esterase/lipase
VPLLGTMALAAVLSGVGWTLGVRRLHKALRTYFRLPLRHYVDTLAGLRRSTKEPVTTRRLRPGIRFSRLVASLAIACTAVTMAASAQAPRVHKDLVYARVNGRPLALDLYLPEGVASPPLLVWVHGGAWTTGSKAGVPPVFVANGFAVASVDFRQSTEARFPAQVHDIKAAIRYLRANAPAYGYRIDRIAIAGDSSGGHLAALVGVTNGHRELEGTVGDCLNQSSNVQAIVVYYGASDLRTILAQSTPFGLNMRRPALERLLGALPDQAPELAALASPVSHVDSQDPPLMLLHGDQDPQMPINQSHELEGAYEKLGLDVTFRVVHGAAHGGQVFYSPPYLKPVLDFLARVVGR